MNIKTLKYRTIDKASIVRDVFRQWWAIVLFALSIAMFTNVVANYLYTPVYTTTTTFVVTTRGTNTSIYQNITSASETAIRFQTILESNVFKRAIAKELNVSNYNATTEVELVNETNLIVLTVKHESALMSYRYIRAIIDNYNTISDYIIKNVVLEVIKQPEIPLETSNPDNVWKLTLLGLLTGLAIGLGYVALFSYLKDTIKNSSEVTMKLAARLLGTVYHEKMRSERRKSKKISMLVTNPVLSFKYTESCRMAASRVESRMDRKNAKIVLVTSVAENEGKSTIASNIAISVAQEGKKVLLIDADFRKPSLYKIFDINKEEVTNFVGILRDGVGTENLIIKLKKYPLYLILNNTSTGSIEDVLANNRLSSLLRFARDSFDYIVIDTAPMGRVTDAEGIATLCDASIMVVREDTILAKNINDAIDSLNDTRAKILGIIYNDAKKGEMPLIKRNSPYRYSR